MIIFDIEPHAVFGDDELLWMSQIDSYGVDTYFTTWCDDVVFIGSGAISYHVTFDQCLLP